MRKFLALIDADATRRAAVTRFFLERGHHVEPYESTDELRRHFPSADLILVNDEGPTLDDLFDTVVDDGIWRPLAAYAVEPSIERAVDVMVMGAIDYLKWPMSPSAMTKRLFPAIEGQNCYAELSRRAFEARLSIQRLSARQREVLHGLSRGLSNKEIACRLDISPRTVEIHRALLNEKLKETEWATPHEIAFYSRIPVMIDPEGPLADLDQRLPRPFDTER